MRQHRRLHPPEASRANPCGTEYSSYTAAPLSPTSLNSRRSTLCAHGRTAMDLNNQDESQNVEDVRGSGGFRPIHGIGLGTIAFAVIAGWFFGISPMQILGLLSGNSAP